MKIGIDIDGVLRDFTSSLISVYKRRLPNETCVNHSDEIKEFDLSSSFSIGNRIVKFFSEEYPVEIFGEAKRYEQSKEFLKKLSQFNDIVLISHQVNDITKNITDQWLIKNDMVYETIYEKDKYKVDIDILLDDYTKNLESFMNIGKIAVCFDRSWNKDFNGFRVHSYDEFIEFIKNLTTKSITYNFNEIVLGKY